MEGPPAAQGILPLLPGRRGDGLQGGESLGVKEEEVPPHTHPHPHLRSNNKRCESAGLGKEITRHCSSLTVVLVGPLSI